MKIARKPGNRVNRSLPALAFVGGSLAAIPAVALELGDITVHSRLGQPLRASIAYALAPNEQLAARCITVNNGRSASGLPGIGNATIRVGNSVIDVFGGSPIREPMLGTRISISCPYAPKLSREYLFFVDPAELAYAKPVLTVTDSVTVEAANTATVVAAAPANKASQQPIKDLGQSTRYQVKPGDSLSQIAQRIENRPVGLWATVDAIYAANPNAFLDNDPNRLKAGSWLAIPAFGGESSVIANQQTPNAVVTPAVQQNIPTQTVETSLATSVSTAEGVESESIAIVPEGSLSAAAPEADTVVVEDTTKDLQPGDIIIPDTRLEGPTTSSASPNVPIAVIRPPTSGAAADASWGWLGWLVGSGIAIIMGLLLFGRRLRDGSAETPERAAADAHRRRASDVDSTAIEAQGEDIDFDLSDDSPTAENLALDADLIIGTGLEESSTTDLSQDFGFAATTELDIELPFEPVASGADKTDIMQPLKIEESSILKSEILPGDDDYDMSVIMDATKMPTPEDVTERDLHAVEVAAVDDTLAAQSYTINQDIDFEVLEQDYEDELTATQALNAEIARAATELADRPDGDTDDGDATAALPMASITELDISAQLPAQNDDDSNLEDTGINEAVTVNLSPVDETVEMPRKSEKAS